MSMEYYIPYEDLAREESGTILEHTPTVLGSLSCEQRVAVIELLAHAVARGIEYGFAMSDFAGLDPASAMDIYNAGIAQAKFEGEI
jgi:hypothetical protein